MAILVYAETSEQNYKKSTFEAVSYAKSIGNKLGQKVIAVVIGAVNQPESLGNYGADEVVQIPYTEEFNSEIYADLLAQTCKSRSAETVIITNSYAGKAICGRVAVKLQASLATNVIGYPETENGFVVKRGVYSGKAYGYVNMTSPVKVLALTPNSFEIQTTGGTAAVSEFSASVPASSVKLISSNKVSGKIPLTEAEIVVSGGRGMKGPENWGMIEELAGILGGATACSKPVSDMHWRPHSEHVGQTGITIKPNLYIAVGISGAIQHLAGVSSSKVIVAINKDPEAPFFKAADYGIVGDAFEILPKIIEAAKAAKS
jgi:electron transfer flavoprotein alpha subunit